MSDRKAELEAKKAQLKEIREEKRKKEERKLGLTNGTADASGKTGDLRVETEEMLKELGIKPQEPEVLVQKSPSHVNGETKMTWNFKIFTASEIDIQPQEAVNYSKETQTINEGTSLSNREKDLSADSYYVPTFDDVWDEDDLLSPNFRTKIKPNTLHSSLHNGPDVEEFESLKEPPKMPTLSDTELNQRLMSAGFLKFFNKSSRIIERALCAEEEGDEDAVIQRKDSRENKSIQDDVFLARSFFDEKWTKQRVVSALDWSEVYPELLLTAYQANEQAPTQPAGVCTLWNMLYPNKTSPEYIFHCLSPVTSACLSKFHPNLVIGGTHSGMICLWDMRSHKLVPVQKTPISQKNHSHPVFAVQVVGTQNAHNIVSLSSDGVLRTWAIDNLVQPVETTKVLESPGAAYQDISPTCMSFFANDVNNFAIGAENSHAYTEQRHSSRSGGVRHETNKPSAYEGHTSPITSISCHPSTGEINFATLFLTTSLDWSTRLWSVRDKRSIFTFGECYECVYDAQWSPRHPALFATADGNGRVNLWDLNRDFEAPTVSKRVGVLGDDDAYTAGVAQVAANFAFGSSQHQTSAGATFSSGPAGNSVALCKLRWNHSGSLLATGDVAGRVHVYSVGDGLAKPGQDSWARFGKQLQEMKNTSMDMLLDQQVNATQNSIPSAMPSVNSGSNHISMASHFLQHAASKASSGATQPLLTLTTKE